MECPLFFCEQMNEKAIGNRLVEHGEKLFRAPKQLIRFTGNQKADILLNDIEKHPHTFVLACVMDRQIKAEKAWLIPYLIAQKIGGFSMKRLIALSAEDVRRLMSEPEPLHRFLDKMSVNFYRAVQKIATAYSNNAALIWLDKPSSAEVVYHFLEFDGVGPSMALVLRLQVWPLTSLRGSSKSLLQTIILLTFQQMFISVEFLGGLVYVQLMLLWNR